MTWLIMHVRNLLKHISIITFKIMDKKYLKLTLDKAQETYKNGNAEVKKLLTDLYGEEHFLSDIKDRVNSYESACKITGRDVLDIDDFEMYGDEAKRMFARYKITTGIKAINEGWKPDFDNTNQPKYYIWMYGKKNGFSSCVDFSHFVFTYVGSDLHIETNDKAKVIEKVFRQEYIDYLF